MHPDVDTATETVAATRAELARLPACDVSAQLIEDALTDGYAHALEAEAWSMRAEQRLRELIDDTSLPIRAHEIRTLALEHSALKRSVAALRRELAALSREHEQVVAATRRRSR